MTRKELKKLGRGDCVRNRMSGRSYTVLSNDRGRCIAALVIEIDNPPEWEVVGKVDYNLPDK